MTFFNHFTSININISNFCSGFGGIIPQCFRNFAIMSTPWFTGFNCGMSFFNNFSMFSGFTNYSSLNNMQMSSLWNLNPTNIQPPMFNNYNGDSSNIGSIQLSTLPQAWGMSNVDTFYRTNSGSSGSNKRGTGGSHEYSNLSRNAALQKAANDSNLEKLSGGSRWSISNASFKNDIPYAKKGVSAFLNHLCSEINENLTITSALGTSSSPHAKNGGYSSHYNSKNPKLDIGGGLSPEQANKLAAKLKNTGYFSRVEVEVDGNTAHLDVQIKESVLNQYA